jgi:hypothetical protein
LVEGGGSLGGLVGSWVVVRLGYYVFAVVLAVHIE